MIEEHAVVVAVEAGIAEVEIQRRSGCNACSARAACGVSLLDRVLGRRPQRLVLTNKLDAAQGEEIIIGMPEGALLKAALAAYMLPLFALLGGALIGEQLSYTLNGGQALSLLGGLSGLVFGLIGTRLYSRRLANDPRWRAVMLRRVPAGVAIGMPSMR